MDNIIKRSEINKLKNIQFNIDSHLLEPEETVSYLTGLGYSEQQIGQLLTLVYWANDEENPNCNIDKLLENGWMIDNEDGTNTAYLIPSTNSLKISARCICCGGEVLLDYVEGTQVQACLCDKCKDAIKAMRKFLPEDKIILTKDESGEMQEGDITISVQPPVGIRMSEYHSWYQGCCSAAKITFEQLSYAMYTHPSEDIFIIREKKGD